MAMKRVFICSPYRGDTARNTDIARALCHQAIRMGFAPFAPHLLYPQFLDEQNAAERKAGMAAGMKFLATCEQLWVWKQLGVTEGMLEEMNLAEHLSIEVRDVSWIMAKEACNASAN